MNIWHNTYFTLDVDWRLKRYMKQELNVVLVSDIMNEDTNLPLTLSDWKDYIREADTENGQLCFDSAGCTGSRVGQCRKPWNTQQKKGTLCRLPCLVGKKTQWDSIW